MKQLLCCNKTGSFRFFIIIYYFIIFPLSVVYRIRSGFEHFMPKWSTFWDLVKLRSFYQSNRKYCRLKKLLLTRSWDYETTIMIVPVKIDHLMVFLQLPINSIFPLSVVNRIMGWGLFVCMYSCISVYVCISLFMYVLCMHVSVYVCMYHTYVHDACMYAMIFFLNYTI